MDYFFFFNSNCFSLFDGYFFSQYTIACSIKKPPSPQASNTYALFGHSPLVSKERQQRLQVREYNFGHTISTYIKRYGVDDFLITSQEMRCCCLLVQVEFFCFLKEKHCHMCFKHFPTEQRHKNLKVDLVKAINKYTSLHITEL